MQACNNMKSCVQACRDDLNRKAEQLKHTDTVVKRHVTMSVLMCSAMQ